MFYPRLINDVLLALKCEVSFRKRTTYRRSIHLRTKVRSFLECCYKIVPNSLHPVRFVRKKLLKYKLHYIINTLGIRKINLGCGYENFPEGWLNIGLFNEKDINYAQVKKINHAYVLHFDLTKELPIESGSVQYLYSSHFLEHIQFEQAIALFKRLRIMLIKGGVLRLTVPDLGLWINKYYENDEKFFKDFYKLIKSFSNLKTKGEIFAGQIFGYGHHWAYDYDSLKDMLQRAGFTKIAKKKYGDSSIFKIGIIEPSHKMRRMESLCVEAIK